MFRYIPAGEGGNKTCGRHLRPKPKPRPNPVEMQPGYAITNFGDSLHFASKNEALLVHPPRGAVRSVQGAVLMPIFWSIWQIIPNFGSSFQTPSFSPFGLYFCRTVDPINTSNEPLAIGIFHPRFGNRTPTLKLLAQRRLPRGDYLKAAIPRQRFRSVD